MKITAEQLRSIGFAMMMDGKYYTSTAKRDCYLDMEDGYLRDASDDTTLHDYPVDTIDDLKLVLNTITRKFGTTTGPVSCDEKIDRIVDILGIRDFTCAGKQRGICKEGTRMRANCPGCTRKLCDVATLIADTCTSTTTA